MSDMTICQDVSLKLKPTSDVAHLFNTPILRAECELQNRHALARPLTFTESILSMKLNTGVVISLFHRLIWLSKTYLLLV